MEAFTDDGDPFLLRNLAVPLLQPVEMTQIEYLPKIVRQLHEQIEVPAGSRLVAEIVLQAEAVMLLNLEVVFDVPSLSPPNGQSLRRSLRF